MALTDAQRQALLDVVDKDSAELFKDLYSILSKLSADPWPEVVENKAEDGRVINRYRKE